MPEPGPQVRGPRAPGEPGIPATFAPHGPSSAPPDRQGTRGLVWENILSLKENQPSGLLGADCCGSGDQGARSANGLSSPLVSSLTPHRVAPEMRISRQIQPSDACASSCVRLRALPSGPGCPSELDVTFTAPMNPLGGKFYLRRPTSFSPRPVKWGLPCSLGGGEGSDPALDPAGKGGARG